MGAVSALGTEVSVTRKYNARVCLTSGSANHPSGNLGIGLELIMSPSRLDEDSCSFYEYQFDL